MARTARPSTQRSGALDLFRFFAVLIIFLAHYTDTFNFRYHIVPENLKWSPVSHYCGIAAILIFFMVSGYVVTMTSMKRNIKDFLIIRLTRIYPLFWISCIVGYLLPRLIHDHTYLMHFSLKTLLANMTMAPMLFGQEWANPVYYTLLVEMLFYYFIGFIILFKAWTKSLLIIAFLLAYCLLANLDATAAFHVIIPPFIGGMLFYFIRIKYADRWKLYTLLGVNYICSILDCRYLVYNLGDYYNNPQAVNLLTMSVITTAIYLVLYLVTINKIKIKSSPFTLLLGEIAYPFYLFHLYFLCVYWYFRNTIQADLLLLGILLVILTASRLINVLIEKPISKLANHLLRFITGFHFRRIFLARDLKK